MLVDVDVAVAVAVDHHGHGGVVADALDQRRPAARYQAVDDFGELHERDRRFVADVVDEDHGVVGQPGLRRAVAQHGGDRGFVRNAHAEPRSNAALPAFRQIPAASLVTLGRFS